MQPRNPYLCLAIVVMLGLLAVVATGGIVLANLGGRDSPSSLVAIVSTCIGALASFLVSVPRGSVGGDGNSDPRRG